MIITTEGIIFKSVKTVNDRQMLSIFTKKLGKVNIGTGLGGRTKKKADLFLKPFTLSNYQIYRSNDFLNLNYGEVKKSYYNIGLDVDKYSVASNILEISDKILPDNVPAPSLFNDLIGYLDLINDKNSNFMLISLSYKLKLLKEMGYLPDFKKCVYCNKVFDTEETLLFDVSQGEIFCDKCKKTQDISNDTLIYEFKFGIVDIINFLTNKSMLTFKNLALEDDIQEKISEFINSYFKYHLQIYDLKSEGLFKFDC